MHGSKVFIHKNYTLLANDTVNVRRRNGGKIKEWAIHWNCFR